MGDDDWSRPPQEGGEQVIGMWLNGDAIPEPDKRGHRIVGDSFLVMFNAHHEPIAFTLPPEEYGEQWVYAINTAAAAPGEGALPPESQITVESRSVVVLRCPRSGGHPG